MASERLQKLCDDIRQQRATYGYARPGDIVKGFRLFIRLRNEGRDADLTDNARRRELWAKYKNELQRG
jgi:hypothetical protein